MTTLVWDCEANGLLNEADRIHCLVTKDVDTGDVERFGPNQIEEGLRKVMQADVLIGHHQIGYDLPLASKLYPWFSYERSKVVDTLILSRLIWSNLSDLDYEAKAFGKVDGKLIGSHSLKAWGQRLGFHKLEFDQWDYFTPEMLEYNVVDVEVTDRLWALVKSQNVDPRASELEHSVAFICAQQERHGFSFDVEKAQRLTAHLQGELARLETDLQDTFQPFYLADGEVVPKRTTNGKKQAGTWEGAPYTRIKLTVFNPGSRQHIANRLNKLYNWIPKEFTPSGQPKIDETVLEKLPWPEAKLLNRYFLVQKRLGLLIGADKDKGWLNVVRNGRVYGEVITNGAVTGRMTHKIIANIPRVTTPYGHEVRELFRATPGRKLVGCDVSGLELRMLAHFMARWDGGKYGKEVVEGDVHTINQQAAGLPDRNAAKTFVYGFLYGAGPEKLGSIVGKGKKEGLQLRKKFLAKTPALAKLLEAVGGAAERGYLTGLDGRKLHIRSSHAALNTLLQSAGALVCKRWVVELDAAIEELGWRSKAQQLIVMHDEVEVECEHEIAEDLGKLAVECISRAGAYFNIRVPLTGEYKVGDSWADCH